MKMIVHQDESEDYDLHPKRNGCHAVHRRDKILFILKQDIHPVPV